LTPPAAEEPDGVDPPPESELPQAASMAIASAPQAMALQRRRPFEPIIGLPFIR
jgi:hypothetical protein